MCTHSRPTVLAVIVLALSLAHAEARHEREHARKESELTGAIKRLIDHFPVIRYLHSVRIENLRLSEDGARVQPRLDRNGHQETTYPRIPLYDHIYPRSGNIVTTTEAPGKRVTVALALRDLEELKEERDLENKIFRLFAKTYWTIFQSDRLICIAMVDLHAEVSEDRGGYTRLSVLGPVFGTSMTAQQAKDMLSVDFDEYWVQQTLTREFIRAQFRMEIELLPGRTSDWLLGHPPDWNRPREGHPCRADD